MLSNAVLLGLSQHIHDWVQLARQLGLHEEDIESIARSRQKQSKSCYKVLKESGVSECDLVALLTESRLANFVSTGDASMFVK